MNLIPMSPYFIIRTPKKEQDDKREKIGSLYVHFKHLFMTRECQAGEIVGIGKGAARIFPEARPRQILIHHHFVSGKEAEGSDEGRYMILETETHRYYTVTCESFAGRQNETYGVYDGTKIIPHPEFIFLKKDEVSFVGTSDDFYNQSTKKTSSGIILFSNWAEDRETNKQRMDDIKMKVQELSKNVDKFGNIKDEVKREIENLENIMSENSKKNNKRMYEPKKVAYSSMPGVKEEDTVYSLNLASKTQIEFQDKTYFVVRTKFVSSLQTAN